ncbi:MAG: ThuA domain-containing protein [Pirellulales bacterium]
MNLLRSCFVILALSASALVHADESQWLTFPGGQGPGAGKKIVLIAGDDEYRSEEALPLLAHILSTQHGFHCTVLFPIEPESGKVKPDYQNNIPGMEHLAEADLVVLGLRFRELPDEQMRYFDEYVNSGKPIIGLRTATHSFNYEKKKDSPYAHYDWRSSTWPGGFGQQVLGETWISHHGNHRSEATRGVINWQLRDHPILRGVKDVFGPTDVYGIRNLGADADVVMFGAVLEGMNPTDKAVNGEKNSPLMPLVWTKSYTGRSGRPSRVVCTTMGAAVDLLCEDLRRMLVNACYWSLGMEASIPERAEVSIPASYQPTFYGFGSYKKDLKPADFKP